ncbi:MAG: hypothetical protein GTO53_03110 [Planctomycetales bacterium]|nr:hypothetical protein [Planctomycetales bacterium]NIM08157.1 hypothetical protein [Planctomycetales bacterium]NIN07649.1 hypothetical protein [Planctomycetales bacterium]NIN76767.1 hypothetical protein [Planctomycetales bacterium]NIO33976.1 hypothetical protein [Planctomycetales bacterium]
MLFDDGLSDRIDHFLHIRLAMFPFDFMCDHQPFFAPFIDRESDAATASQHLVSALDGGFDIMGIKVSAADDNHIFQSPGDKQFAPV